MHAPWEPSPVTISRPAALVTRRLTGEKPKVEFGVLPQSTLFSESTLRHTVESRPVLVKVCLPPGRVPKLKVVADAHQHHVVLQPGELHQTLR